MLDKSDINILLRQTIAEGAVERWWETPVPAIGGKTPAAIWVTGNRETVAKLAISYMKPLSFT